METKCYFLPDESDERYRPDIAFMLPVLMSGLTIRYRVSKVKDRFDRQDYPYLRRQLSGLGERSGDAESRAVASCWPRILNMIYWDHLHLDIKPTPTPINNVLGFVRKACSFAKIAVYASTDPRFNYAKQRIVSICKTSSSLSLIDEKGQDSETYKAVVLKDTASVLEENDLLEWLQTPEKLKSKLATEFGSNSEVSEERLLFILGRTGGSLRLSRLALLVASTLNKLEIEEPEDGTVDDVAASKTSESADSIVNRLDLADQYAEMRAGYRSLDVIERRLIFLSERQESDLTIFEATQEGQLETPESLAELLEVTVNDIRAWKEEFASFRQESNQKISKRFVARLTGIEEAKVEGKLKSAREKLERKLRVLASQKEGEHLEA